MTSTEPSQAPPSADNALSAALANEHAVIYGYGIVSAHCAADANTLVSSALTQHRQRRDRIVTLLADRKVTAPVPAAGYRLPMPVNTPIDAARLAARMESDTETAWRAFLEQAQTADDRTFAVTALTESTVMAARWRQRLGDWPLSSTFPGAD